MGLFIWLWSSKWKKKLVSHYHRASAFKLFQPITTMTKTFCNGRAYIKFRGSQDCSLPSIPFRTSDLFWNNSNKDFLWKAFQFRVNEVCVCFLFHVLMQASQLASSFESAHSKPLSYKQRLYLRNWARHSPAYECLWRYFANKLSSNFLVRPRRPSDSHLNDPLQPYLLLVLPHSLYSKPIGMFPVPQISPSAHLCSFQLHSILKVFTSAGQQNRCPVLPSYCCI